MTRYHKTLLTLAVLLLLSTSVYAQSPAPPASSDSGVNSLAEVRDKRHALLMVYRSGVVNAADRERSIIEDVLKADPEPRGRHRSVYTQIAKKLNSYIRKYRSLTPARELSEADYVILFNIVEYKQILNTIYPYGELFVIVKGSPETKTPPRVIWKAKKILWAADAINDFIKELKTTRGEG